MLKYIGYDITFSEIPDETSLCLYMSNCPNRCPNCHSPELQKDVGEELTISVITTLLEKYPEITCICFMGGDVYEVGSLSLAICAINPIKVAYYTGSNDFPILFHNLRYVKLGPYIEEFGPLTSKTTNQRLYEIVNGEFNDITYKFWK